MRIALTGGTGFIGSRLGELLTSAGHQVIAIDIYPPRDELPFEFVRCDVRDQPELEKACDGCDAIFHLAAAHHDYGISTDTFDGVNIGGMRSVCGAATQLGISDVVFYSTVAVFGAAKPPLNESTRPLPISDYGRSKLAAESVLQEWTSQNESNRALVMRPTVTFGRNNFANMFSLIRQIESGKYLQIGKCENVKSLSYVENLIAATLFAWGRKERAAWEVYNYVEKPDLTSKQIAETIYSALGRPAPRFVLPYLLARLMVFPLDLFSQITGKNFSVSGARIRKFSRDVTQFEASAIQEIGFRPSHDLPSGITEMTKWYVEEGKRISESGGNTPHLPAEKPSS